MLAFQNVTAAYPGSDRPVLERVSFTLAPGEIAFLTGPSGSGKTTVLRLIHGSLRPLDGSILFDGRPLSRLPLHQLRRRIGIVFQSNRLLRHKSALANVCFAGEVLGFPPGEIKRRAGALLEAVGLHDKRHRLPHQLSLGEQQRVAIARALLNQPRLLLADEPTGNLDRVNADQVMALFIELSRQFGAACLIATHDLPLLRTPGARVFHIDDGRLIEQSEATA